MPTDTVTITQSGDGNQPGNLKLVIETIDDYATRTCCERTIGDIENPYGYQWFGTTPWPSAYASDVAVMMDNAFANLAAALAAKELEVACSDDECYQDGVSASASTTIPDYSFADPSWTGGPASVTLSLQFGGDYRCPDGNKLTIGISMPSPTPSIDPEDLPLGADGDYTFIGDSANWRGNEFARFRWKVNVGECATEVLTSHTPCRRHWTYINRHPLQANDGCVVMMYRLKDSLHRDAPGVYGPPCFPLIAKNLIPPA